MRQNSGASRCKTTTTPFTRILALLVALCGARAARAECQADGIQFFPAPGAVVPTNTRFILEGLGSEQRRVLDLVGKQLIFKADDDIVSAKVLKGWRSEINRAAVLVVPNHTFRADRHYTLLLSSVLPNYLLLASQVDAPWWESGKGPDDRAPRWVRRPAVSGGNYTFEGGKLARYVNLDLELDEQSPAYLVVTLQRSHGSTAEQTYFTPVRDGKAVVGHDACSGGFVFEDGKAYRANILGYDIAGNLAPTIAPIQFDAPRPVNAP